jgi:hypothetical protein
VRNATEQGANLSNKRFELRDQPVIDQRPEFLHFVSRDGRSQSFEVRRRAGDRLERRQGQHVQFLFFNLKTSNCRHQWNDAQGQVQTSDSIDVPGASLQSPSNCTKSMHMFSFSRKNTICVAVSRISLISVAAN